MPLPRATTRSEVLKHRLEPVNGPGELRLSGLPLVELIPQVAQSGSLVGRQDREDPIGGGALGDLLLRLLILVGVQEQVSRVDLDQVVQQHHCGHLSQVGTWRRVLSEHERHHRQMPRMLGRVLRPVQPRPGEHGLPDNSFEPADLSHEPHLPVKPFHGPIRSDSERLRYCGPSPSMCIRNSRATNPTRMPAPLASESSRFLRDPAAGRRMVLGPRRRSRVRLQNFPELARPPPAETGLRRFLARRGVRPLTPPRPPGPAAPPAPPTPDCPRDPAGPPEPCARARRLRAEISWGWRPAPRSPWLQPK